jgi:hypothetical protein
MPAPQFRTVPPHGGDLKYTYPQYTALVGYSFFTLQVPYLIIPYSFRCEQKRWDLLLACNKHLGSWSPSNFPCLKSWLFNKTVFRVYVNMP